MNKFRSDPPAGRPSDSADAQGTVPPGAPPLDGNWTIADAAEEYGIHRWGSEYFSIDENGELCAELQTPDSGKRIRVSLRDVISKARQQGLGSPLLLRFPGFLDAGIKSLNQAFEQAIQRHAYIGKYRGVFPVKVNQQRQVLEEVTEYGSRFKLGFEVGSKPELIAALAYMHRPGTLLVCNGYKDEQFIRLALIGRQLGFDVVLVLEMPQELDTIIRCAEELKVEPSIGFRLKLSAEGYGYWKNSAGERSPFGINSSQLLDLVDQLSSHGRTHWITMLHCHQGSQITALETVERSVNEAGRVYAHLRREGIAIRDVNFGGGLAVDYTGLGKGHESTPNHTMDDYAEVIVATMKRITAEAGVDEPNLVTESGRAISAPYAALVTKVHDVTTFRVAADVAIALPDDSPDVARRLHQLLDTVSEANVGETYSSALEARDQALAGFASGDLCLRDRALCERIYWMLLSALFRCGRDEPGHLKALDALGSILSDQVYANFSIFQSLPDSWAIEQIFPVAPLQRLDQQPTRRCVVNDITCDCDGVIARYPAAGTVGESLMLHSVQPDEDYYLGMFLVGAYQESLSDLHNLFGDTHVVSVEIDDGEVTCRRISEGQSIADALVAVKHAPAVLTGLFRTTVARSADEGRIPREKRHPMISEFEAGLRSYTYLSETDAPAPKQKA